MASLIWLKLTLWLYKYWGQVTATDQLTPDQMKRLFSVFKQFVTEKNLPECKKFIDHYVEKVVVFHDHVELTLKVVVDLHGGGGAYHLVSKQDIKLAKDFKSPFYL